MKVEEPTTSRIHWQPLVGFAAAIVVMSVVVLSGEELKHVPPAAPSYTVLHTFAGYPTDGANPIAGLIRDSAGNLFGTTVRGGAGQDCVPTINCGTVFKLSPTGTETVLHNFSLSGPGDGSQPGAGLNRDAWGNLYGTTVYGGIGCSLSETGCGVVFKLGPGGTETILHTFTGRADGGNPSAALIQDKDGHLYGTTQYGGAGTKCYL
jgi:uncharacterized repeat protein (TIGR03803 family)